MVTRANKIKEACVTSLAELQQWLVRRGVKMTMDEINEIVHEVRRENARAMQRKSAAARWDEKSPEQRSREMRQLRAMAKKRRKTRKPNDAALLRQTDKGAT